MVLVHGVLYMNSLSTCYVQVDSDVWLYYMVELSFYWSLSISQFFDVKRKVIN